MKIKTIDKECLNCHTTFAAPLPEHKRGNAKFCSLKCSSTHRGRLQTENLALNCECTFCHKQFHRSAFKLTTSKSGLQFCSRICKDKAQRIESGFTQIQPDHYGTSNFVYREVAFRHHPHKCNRCDYHQYIDVLIVHHKNRNRSDNNYENLEILCPTCHEVEHFLSKDGKWAKGKNKKLDPTSNALV